MVTAIIRAGVASLLLCASLALAACHSWSPTEIPKPARLLDGNPQEVRVALTDGSALLLRSPSMRGDTLTGITDFGRHASAVRIDVPTTRISTIAVRTPSTIRTTVAVALVAALVGVVVWFVTTQDNFF